MRVATYVTIGIQPGNAQRPPLRGVKGGRIEFWRRLCMSRSRGKSLDSLSPFVYTGHNTPSHSGENRLFSSQKSIKYKVKKMRFSYLVKILPIV
jgi:hypothetical protein